MKQVRNIFVFVLPFFLFISTLAWSQPYFIKTYYDANEDQLKEIFEVEDTTNFVLNGIYKSFYLNGKPKTVGFYDQNTPDSLWTYYFENGNIKMRGTLKKGINTGKWVYYFENGQKSMSGKLVKNKKEGAWQYFYENGNLKIEGQYKNGQKTGEWQYFYENGKKKATTVFEGISGHYKEFYPSGALKAEGKNISGLSEGSWKFYFESGPIKASGQFNNGLRTGIWTYYYKNGIKSAQGQIVKGEKNGKWEYYHDNGILSSEGALQEGKREGYWKLYHRDGGFKGEGIFEQDSGQYKEYYESGSIKVEGLLVSGKNEGVWKYYYEDGQLEGKCLFEAGIGEYTGYYADGKVKMKGRVEDGVNVGLWELYHPDGSIAGYYRPYYEEEPSGYLPTDETTMKNDKDAEDYMKPDYKYKKREIRYFQPVVNEFRGFILGFNPAGALLDNLPVALEYYFQERLGYEIQARIIRNPFFRNDQNVPINELYFRGYDVAFRQKFYHRETNLGVPYFAHEIRFTSLTHYANILDSAVQQPVFIRISAQEMDFEYGFMVGNRIIKTFGESWQKDVRKLGYSIDFFVGLGVGYRMLDKNFEGNQAYDVLFDDLNQSDFIISLRIGINIGVVF
jgi:antitoxin component YwqK of YwqJK toxin-antitoxin module